MSDTIELNRQLEEHSRMLLGNSTEYARLARRAVEARNAYDLAKAKAILKISNEHAGDKAWTVDRVKALALAECEMQMTEARIAEAHLDAMKTRLRAVEASLSSVQTRCRIFLEMEKL